MRIDMYYDRTSAELISKQDFGYKTNGEKFQSLNYKLNVGKIGGWSTKIIYFIVSLVIESLSIKGLLFWYKRGKKKEKTNNRLN